MTEKEKDIMEIFFANTKKIHYGTVSVELKIHAGKCTGVIHTVSENIKQIEKGDDLLKIR